MEFEILMQLKQKATDQTFEYSKCQTKLSSDARKQGLGGTLVQRQGDCLRFVAYASKSWTESVQVCRNRKRISICTGCMEGNVLVSFSQGRPSLVEKGPEF